MPIDSACRHRKWFVESLGVRLLLCPHSLLDCQRKCDGEWQQAGSERPTDHHSYREIPGNWFETPHCHLRADQPLHVKIPIPGWTGLTKLERQLKVLGIERGSTEVAEVVSRQFVLQGSPNGSHDSLFLTAWKGARSQRKLGFSSRLSSSNESK